MKKTSLILAVSLFSLLAFGQARSQPASGVEDLSKPAGIDPPMLGIHWARGFDPYSLMKRAKAQRPRRSPDMTFHNGKILTVASTASIFWGTSWTTPASVGDKISGLDLWYTGFSGSNYAATSDEYTGTNGQVTATITYGGHVIDTSAASGGNSTSAILAEVCKEVTSPEPHGNGYYAVYTDLPRGNANYCAWHSAGSCGGTPVQFAFFWKLDGDPGCDPQSKVTSESQGLAALANVSGHELSEARTDPSSSGWYDSSGQENGDKCVWTFNVPYVIFRDGTEWKIQGEWSNNAYNNNTGYPNSSGQNGCLDGL
jgi:hypothetical protein